jgi:murein L,D-transpeptidase YafK
VSYPNDADRERARKLSVEPGGDIMIHGIKSGLGWIGSLQRAIDWTDGCIAVTDAEMDEIWNLVPDGTPVEIRP